MNYYNEIDPNAAAWLRELIKAKQIPDGKVDERDIRDVTPAELAGFTQCHFFAGIGGWAFALKLAGWPETRPCWTGSCPCQPFSAAGKGVGFDDERHLWPDFFYLSIHGKPRETPLFIEQVASKDGLAWLDLVSTDLEGSGYTFTAVDLSASSVGAPHIRPRLYGVAYSNCSGPTTERGNTSEMLGMAQAEREPEHEPEHSASLSGRSGEFGRMGNSTSEQLEGDSLHLRERRSLKTVSNIGGSSDSIPWSDPEYIYCRDGVWRPIEPGTSPLAHGLPRGMGNLSIELRQLAEVAGLSNANLKDAKSYRNQSLRGYGNGIVPQLAAEFIKAFMETNEPTS